LRLVVDLDVEVRLPVLHRPDCDRDAVRAVEALGGEGAAGGGPDRRRDVVRAADVGPGADLLLCDLFMPDKDGLEVIRELRGEFPATPVVAMRGGGAGGALDLLPEALPLGASGVLYKPFDQVVALAAINRVLRPR